MRFFLLISMLLLSAGLYSQGDSTLYNWRIRNATLEEALYGLADLTGVPISFSNREAEKITGLTFQFKKKSLDFMLSAILRDINFRYEWVEGQVFVIKKERTSLRKWSLSGYLRDAESGEPLIGATIYSPVLRKGATTNEYGYYSLTLQEGAVDLLISYLGYQQRTLPVELYSDQVINLELDPSILLKEIIVTAPLMASPPLGWSAGKHGFLQEDVNSVPSLGGEPDVLRMSYLLPGVQTGADGLGGLSVRGGDVDQNLVLLDGVPVYNAAHLLGAFSVFNSSAIRDAQLIKGVMPARYGGRASSVLDVRTKEGNNKEWEAEADVGLTSGKVSLEGPLVPGKSSIFLGARRAFVDLFSRPLTRLYWENRGKEGELGYYFMDVNAKVNYKLGHDDHLFASFYTGGDDFLNHLYEEVETGDSLVTNFNDARVQWGNLIGSLRWNHLFSRKLFSNTTLTFSRFSYRSKDTYERKVILDDGLAERDYLLFRYNSNNRDVALFTDFDYRPTAGQAIRFGGSVAFRRFQPGAVSFDENSSLDSLTDESFQQSLNRSAQYSREIDLYVEDEFQVSDEFGGNIGMRATAIRVGEEWLFYVQPRIQLYFLAGPNFRASIGVGRNIQSLHLLSNSGVGLPRDLWVSSTYRVRPIDAWQFTGGFQWGGTEKGWSAQVEGYYKTMANLITFQEGLLTAINATNWQNKVAVGEGWSYGAELMVKHTGRRFSGWVAYTLSNSRRLFEEINLGESFPFRFDRRHALHTTAVARIGKKLKVAFVWTYSTGTATTLPLSSYQFNQFNLLYADLPPQFPFALEVSNFGRRNDVRLPDYHRLDLEFQYEWGRKRLKHEFTLGAYNVYYRFNPLYYTLSRQPDKYGQLKPKYTEVALMPLVPTLRYRVEGGLSGGKRR
jgi:hypothetical protein